MSIIKKQNALSTKPRKRGEIGSPAAAYIIKLARTPSYISNNYPLMQ